MIDIGDEDVEEVQRKGDLCLIGKIWVNCIIRKGIIESMMTKIWRLSAKAILREVVGTNVFLTSFSTHSNK